MFWNFEHRWLEKKGSSSPEPFIALCCRLSGFVLDRRLFWVSHDMERRRQRCSSVVNTKNNETNALHSPNTNTAPAPFATESAVPPQAPRHHSLRLRYKQPVALVIERCPAATSLISKSNDGEECRALTAACPERPPSSITQQPNCCQSPSSVRVVLTWVLR